jgi:hypothetical protein
LYEDDGISQDYVKGKGTWTSITWNDKERKLSIQPGGAPKGATNVAARKEFKIQLIPEGTIKRVSYNSRLSEVRF